MAKKVVCSSGSGGSGDGVKGGENMSIEGKHKAETWGGGGDGGYGGGECVSLYFSYSFISFHSFLF